MFKIYFPPSSNIYKVSVDAQMLQFTSLHPSLQKQKQLKIEVRGKEEQIEALNLEHPVIKWIDKLKRQFAASATDLNHELKRKLGILMGKDETPTPVNHFPVLEENHISKKKGKIQS